MRRVCRTHAAILLSASLAAVISVAGCGDGGDESLTKSEFLKSGNAICKKGTEQIDAAGKQAFATPGQPTKQETTAFAKDTVVPNVQSQIDQLRELTPPENDEAQVNAILDQAQVAVDRVKAEPELLGNETASEKANRLARNYGLTACAG